MLTIMLSAFAGKKFFRVYLTIDQDLSLRELGRRVRLLSGEAKSTMFLCMSWVVLVLTDFFLPFFFFVVFFCIFCLLIFIIMKYFAEYFWAIIFPYLVYK